jgi:hypothetical protein
MSCSSQLAHFLRLHLRVRRARIEQMCNDPGLMACIPVESYLRMPLVPKGSPFLSIRISRGQFRASYSIGVWGRRLSAL